MCTLWPALSACIQFVSDQRPVGRAAGWQVSLCTQRYCDNHVLFRFVYFSCSILLSYIPGGTAVSLLHPQPGTDGQHQTPVHCITPLVLMGKNGAQMSLPGTVASVPTGLPLADVGNTTLSTHTPHSGAHSGGAHSGGVSAAAMSLLSSQQQVSTAASCSHCCQYRACNWVSHNASFWNSQACSVNDNISAWYFWEFQSRIALWEHILHALLERLLDFLPETFLSNKGDI